MPRHAEIPLLDLKAQYATIKQEVDAAVLAVLAEQRFILGPEVERLEKLLASRLGVSHALGLSSGTDALVLALLALGVEPGDEVITTDYSFFATAGAVARLGARPVLVDIEADSFSLDLSAAASHVGAKTKAIIAVHLFGRCADIARLRRLVGDSVPVIEDAAQAIDATLDGRAAGSLGAAGCFSFFPSKNLGGFGDGGLLSSDDAGLDAEARALRVHGQRPGAPGRHVVLGGNHRLDALQAAVLRVKLGHLEAWTDGRRRNAASYRRLFGESGLPQRGAVRLPPEETPGCREVYNQFVIRVDAPRRDALREALAHQGIGTAIYYHAPLHRQPCLADRFGRWSDDDFPHACAAAAESLALPVYAELGEQELERVVGAIDESLKK